jgi:hypothetical protein
VVEAGAGAWLDVDVVGGPSGMGRYLLLDAERHEAGLAHGLAGPLALAARAEVSVSGLRTSVRRLAARLLVA